MALLPEQLPTSLIPSGINPFQTDLFKNCWFQHLAEKTGVCKRFGDFVVYRKQTAKGLLKLGELKLVAGNHSWFQDFGKSEFQTFLKLQDDLSWDYFYMTYSRSRKHLQTFSDLETFGFKVLQNPAKPMHMIDLSEGYEGYMKKRNSKDRYNIRQKLRKAETARTELFAYNDIDEFFEIFFRYHIPYWQEKKGYSFFEDPQERDFTVAWAKALYETGALRLHGLRMNGKIANLSFSFLEGDTLYWVLTINTGQSLDLYPGLVSLYLRMQDATAEGVRLFNMAYGTMPYKLQTQTHEDARRDIVIVNPRSLKGKLFGMRFSWKNR